MLLEWSAPGSPLYYANDVVIDDDNVVDAGDDGDEGDRLDEAGSCSSSRKAEHHASSLASPHTRHVRDLVALPEEAQDALRRSAGHGEG